ncbi:MAG: hypothetical protein AAF483_13565 [Planctomycetota bacterium]
MIEKENPYIAPADESHALAPRIVTRIAWLVIPVIIGVLVGANSLTWVSGISPSDPFGTTRASGLGGLIGLVLGIVGLIATRPRP